MANYCKLQKFKNLTIIKLLLSPELAKPVNTPLRQQIISILQQRKGNAFVQHLLGKGAGGKQPLAILQ